MYNYNHLYYYYITAQFASITKASEYLKISQPSLSSQIKILEESMGVSLFIRNGRNIELTQKGKIIYSFCSKMFKETDGLSKFLNNIEGENNELLKIAVSDQIERPFIAEIIGKFMKKNKTDKVPKIILSTGTHESLVTDFNMGEYDLFISHSNKSFGKRRFDTVDLPVALIGLPKFLFKDGKNYKNISSFLKNNQSGFIMPDDSFKLRDEIDVFFTEEKFRPEINFESNILSANVRCLIEGAGVAFLPIAYVKKEIKKGILASYAPSLGFWNHQLYISTKVGDGAQKSSEEFKMLFLEEVNINSVS
ncbi:LysR family transcriptional regulator [Bacteriovorax sp. PP10]|uniref:LysR family transcriptional regulator n=1 Tax=Bacteriovorax antarcticus TaxID=3088717 RepID=A0ABU5VW78_9BACT|nr:LysR family transcriptional regulator [Bacteriovorax sp. PP10]MEA9356285.1 LysR family transcriptional regulator [Bacteriovorax sp. PP10]